MRIAVLHPSFAVFGGTEKLIFDLYPALAQRGHEVTLFTSDLSDADAAANLPGVKVVDIGPLAGHGDVRMFAEQIRVGQSIAMAFLNFDVVRMHGIPSPTWWLRACEAEPGLRAVESNWCCHGIMGGLYDDVAAAHLLAARARGDAPAAPSISPKLGQIIEAIARRGLVGAFRRALWEVTGGRQRLIAEALRVQEESVCNLTTVVTDSRFVADYLHTIWGVDAVVCHPGLQPRVDVPVTPPGDELLTVCRLQESKNVASVVHAIASLREAGPLPFSRYVVAGDGADMDRLVRLTKHLNLDDVIRFDGMVANEDLDEYFDRAGVFILPALDESFGVTYLEAAARARAAIGPNHGGPSEIVVDGETGWIVEPTDVQALADAITQAFGDADELRRRGLAAKHRVETEFSMERFVQCTERTCGARRHGTSSSTL